MVGQGVTEKALSDGHKVIALDMGPTSLRSNDSTISPEPKAGEGIEGTDGKDGKGEEGNYKYYQLDATDYQSYYDIVKGEGCTAIIHLAATFNKFGDNGELTSNVHSHVSPPIPSTQIPIWLLSEPEWNQHIPHTSCETTQLTHSLRSC